MRELLASRCQIGTMSKEEHMSQDTAELSGEVMSFAVEGAGMQVLPSHGVWKRRLAVFQRVIADPEVDISLGAFTSNPQHTRSRLRLGVARGLAAEGVVLSPSDWANVVRDIADFIEGASSNVIITESMKVLRQDKARLEIERRSADERYEGLRAQRRRELSTTSGLITALGEIHGVEVDVLEEENVDDEDGTETLRIHFSGIRLGEDGNTIEVAKTLRDGRVKVGISGYVYVDIEEGEGDDDDIINKTRAAICLTDGSEYNYDGHDVYIEYASWGSAEFIY